MLSHMDNDMSQKHRKFKQEPIHFSGRYKSARPKASGAVGKIFNIVAKPAKTILNSRFGQALIIGSALVYGEEIKNSVTSVTDKTTHFFSAPSFDETNEDLNYRTAIREAGRAVTILALASRTGLDLDYVTINPRHDMEGSVVTADNQHQNEYRGTRENYLANILVSYSGLVTEQLLLGIKTQAGTDLDYAVTLAEEMIMHQGLAENLVPLDFKSLHNKSLMSEENLVATSEQIETILCTSYYSAECIAETYNSQIEILAEALMRDRDHYLTGAEVKKLLKYSSRVGLPYHNDEGKLFYPDWRDDPLTHFGALAEEKMEQIAEENADVNSGPKPEA